ncbi:MAG: hypothetical protein ABFS35_05285 [Bacteroidota bacterium]
MIGKKLKNRIENTSPAIKEDILTLPSQIKADFIKLDLNTLLFIHSDGNYIEVYFEENDKIK